MEIRKWLLAVVAMACAISAAPGASAEARGLSATIESDRSFLSDAEAAIVRVELRNDAAQDLYVLRWHTAVKGIEGNLFDVRLDGKPVAYTGRLYKQGPAQAEDYIRIPAGRSLSAEVDLSRYYDMTRTGEYSVRYRVPVQDALVGVGTKIAASNLRQIESNVLMIGVERTERGRLLQQLAQEGPGRDGIDHVAGNYLTPGFVSCSTTRQSTLRTALSYAERISLNSRNYLNSLPSTSRPTDTAYRTWFGAYTSSRYSTVQSHFNNIYSAFNTKTVQFYCDCTSSAYAYVYSNQPYKIHLCNAFWNAPMTGTDSKSGTLVHEMSHFSVVAGTRDYAYGQSACRSLATSNPDRAINNADSHEYFAEPRL